MRDMTKGSPLSHLWRYAVPVLLGNWLQLSYNAIDTIIAGRFIGKDALAAEGIAGPVMNLVILAITGLCIGAEVLMSEAYGAKDHHARHLHPDIHPNGVYLSSGPTAGDQRHRLFLLHRLERHAPL